MLRSDLHHRYYEIKGKSDYAPYRYFLKGAKSLRRDGGRDSVDDHGPRSNKS